MGISSRQQKHANELLENISTDLDISESYFDKAVARYQSIGDWLGRKESSLLDFNPKVYPQGSLCLGTVIKPLSNADDYDLDIVIELDLSKKHVTQKRLKELIGVEIIGYAKAHNMNHLPKNGKRCWAVEYAEGANFHMDILPSIPDDAGFRMLLEAKQMRSCHEDFAISITDKEWPNYNTISQDWPQSNPKGYAAWFKERTELAKHIAMFAESRGISIDEVPEFRVKTPLQRAVQLLKRHRDLVFQRNGDFKPISIIITTLSALAYKGESDVLAALSNITSQMGHFIVFDGRRYSIKNPVNPLEDFADRWSVADAEHFFKWLKQAQEFFGSLVEFADDERSRVFLAESLGMPGKRVAFSHGSEHSKIACPPNRTIQNQPRAWRR